MKNDSRKDSAPSDKFRVKRSKTFSVATRTNAIATSQYEEQKNTADANQHRIKRQHSRLEDLAILTDEEARGWEIDAAEYWLVTEASRLYGSSPEARDTIIGLREIMDRGGHNDLDRRPADREARQAREATACLQKIFSNLSGSGKNLSDPEVRQRVRLMPTIATGPLRELIQLNPISDDAIHPVGRAIRENAQSLLGEIEAEAILRRISKASYINDPEPTEPLWKLLISVAVDIYDETGLGTIRQLREWADDWKPEQNKAGENTLHNIAIKLMLNNGDGINNPLVRLRLRAAGPAVVSVLQALIDANPGIQDTISPEGRSRRQHAANIINEIGQDLTQKNLQVLGLIFNNGLDAERLAETSQIIVTRAADINNPLGLSTVQALRRWTDDWQSHTPQYEAGEAILHEIAVRLIPDGQALDSANVRERLRTIGAQTITVLESIVERNAAGVQHSRNLIAVIQADERFRTPAKMGTKRSN
jgi:hypothetical protein